MKQHITVRDAVYTDRFRSAIPKGPPFWKPSFMVVVGNSSWYCHNQTTYHNPNRIPNRKLSLLEMAENGGPSEWRAYTVRTDCG